MIRQAVLLVEIAILSALILATRCANYRDVFVAGNIYFTDADCYARMTRVRMCEQHPGLIVRHHVFENYPQGTIPHTTAPLDYLIFALSILLRPFSAHAIDLAGAFISPLLALLGGWFLWWWSRRMRFRYRWAMLLLYAISPILVHGDELGRPDHQSLAMLLVTIAICAEWTLQIKPSPNWSAVSGVAWGIALWVSFYEPFTLLAITLVMLAAIARENIFARSRRIGWTLFTASVALAFAVERRIPSLSIFASGEIFRNWSRAIGELAHVWPLNPVWFRWAGYMIAVAPILIWLGFRTGKSTRLRQGSGVQASKNKDQAPPMFIIVLLAATYLLTIWQARWAYFFCRYLRLRYRLCLNRSNRTSRFGSGSRCRSFRFCVIGTSGFGQRKWNTRAEWNSATNRCNCAIWRPVWNRGRCVRFSRRGGFHPRLHIGLGNPVWLAVRMRA